MKPQEAKLLLLRHSGLSYKELAKALGVAPGSIGSMLTRAERKFAKKYRQIFGKEGRLLRQLVLQPADLPPGSDYHNNGPYQLNLPSNPLFEMPDFDPEEVANYYHIFATVPISLANGQPGLLPVMNHAYRYHSAARAAAQWQAVADQLQLQATEVISLSGAKTKLITVKLTGIESTYNEENRVFWGVLQRDEVLVVLVVDDLTIVFEPTNPVGRRLFMASFNRLVRQLE